MLEVVSNALRSLETACSGSRDQMQSDLVALCKGWLWGCQSPKAPDGVDERQYYRINDRWKDILINIQGLVCMLGLPDNGFCMAANRTLFESSEEDDDLIYANISCWAGEKRCHQMTLNEPWFGLVKSGAKAYEGRRRTEKTEAIRTGDLICFHHADKSETLPFFKSVQKVLSFPTFEDALRAFGPESVLPLEGMTVARGVETYKKYVSIGTQLRDGVVMIRLGPLGPLG